jgi:hypothetical protein
MATGNNRGNQPAVMSTRIEKDGRYPGGRVRTRYAGKGKRGAPSRVTSDLTDVEYAIVSLAKAKATLAALVTIPDKRERDARRLDALGQVRLARRFCEDVLERAGM